MKDYFKNKKILITGAASGIGKDLSLVLHDWGAELFLIDLKKVDLTLYENLKFVTSFEADVTNEESLIQIKNEIFKKIDSVDIIIAAAGVGGLNPGKNFSAQMDRKVMSINYFGTINSITPFLDSMIKKRKGQIVGISSLAAFRGLPAAASYSASKAAQMTMLESLRLDLLGSGVDVTCIHPGFVETPMANHSDFDMPFKVSARKSSLLILKAIKKRKKQYCYPWPMAILSKINRLLPNCVYDFLLPKLNSPQANTPKLFSATNSDIKSLENQSER